MYIKRTRTHTGIGHTSRTLHTELWHQMVQENGGVVANVPGFVASLDLLLNDEKYTLSDVALMFGLSRERIRQYRNKHRIASQGHQKIIRVWDDTRNRFVPVGEARKRRPGPVTAVGPEDQGNGQARHDGEDSGRLSRGWEAPDADRNVAGGIRADPYGPSRKQSIAVGMDVRLRVEQLRRGTGDTCGLRDAEIGGWYPTGRFHHDRPEGLARVPDEGVEYRHN